MNMTAATTITRIAIAAAMITLRRWLDRSVTINVSDVRKEDSLFIIPCSDLANLPEAAVRAVLI
jgi:hypothetical protein